LRDRSNYLSAILKVIDTSIVKVALTDIQASIGASLSKIGLGRERVCDRLTINFGIKG
jgi:hypothetical protein